jgi:hypothetical protein
MCECISYNRPDLCPPNGTREVVVAAPPHMPKDNGYCIDACIVGAIKMLWSHGVRTDGCCCGHNGAFGNPSVIVTEREDAERTKRLLAEHDYRTWDVMQCGRQGVTMQEQERRVLEKTMYLRTAQKLADPDCRTCAGRGIVAWGLRANGGFTWTFPCITCRNAEYVACGEAMATKFGGVNNAP